MRLLVVDDEYKKIEGVVSAAKETDQYVEVQHATTAREARGKLRVQEFDVLLVDLNLPSVPGDSPTMTGGIEFVKMILLDKQCSLPVCILFITEHEGGLGEYSQQAMAVGGEIHIFSAGGAAWKAALQGKMKYASHVAARRTPTVDVAIITALRNPELTAVLNLPYKWIDYRVSSDPTLYHMGSLEAAGRTVTVVAASAMRKGMASSASLSSRMVAHFRPRLLVMPGICAGRRSKSSFGDLVVADPAWDWGSGKRTVGNGNEPAFLMSPHQVGLDPEIGQMLNGICHDPDVIHRVRSRWNGAVPQGALAATVSPFASGASVLADGQTIDEIQRTQNRDVVAVDMEAYAVMEAANYTSGPRRVRAVAMKSVCDFGDGEKGDEWQEYASFTSAQFMNELISSEQFGALLDQ